MQNVKAALQREVEAARDLLKIHKVMDACGYPENPFWDNYAAVADGIYKLIGEHTDTFEESITHLALTTPYLTVDRRVEMLIAEYRKNFPEQPKPITSENDGNKREGYTYRKIIHDSYINSSSVTRSRPQDKVTLT